MNDNEIRMEILFDNYNAMKDGARVPFQNDNEKLKKIDSKYYDFNYGVLVKGRFVEGDIDKSDDGAEVYTPTGNITITGIVLVEKFIDQCVENTKTKISKSLSYVQQISELVILWTKNSDLLQQALELLSHLMG